MIRKATLLDIDSILKITRACAKLMISNGIYQWNENYPNEAAFENDILRDELYVFVLDNSAVGCMAMSTLMDEEYQLIEWMTPNSKQIYIHRLAVHPDHQGKGIAQKLMDFAELSSKKNNYRSIRLDTFSLNKGNQKFYELRGYSRLGNVYFRNQSDHPFYCYELIL